MEGQRGLYNPAAERAACGLGFVAQVRGVASHAIVVQGITLLENLAHRGAEGCDAETGDGAGILVQVPDEFLRRALRSLGHELPARGAYAVGVFFLPASLAPRQACELEVARVLGDEGFDVLCWRDVPVDLSACGLTARHVAPHIRQAIIVPRIATRGARAFERHLYIARRQVENTLSGRNGFHVASLSSQTVVYKGMLKATQLRRFFPDLRDPSFASAIALVHARFSTNTTPSWARAHPYRFICHNGEINTLRGNLNWMRVRESCVKSPMFGEEITKVFPIIQDDQSDTACLDNALEFLVRGGRTLPHAMAMLVPEAWEGNAELDLERRGFYEFHNAMMEAWDGPALVAFSDGHLVGGVLDRNGLRPARYVVTTDDRVVLSSEAGALDIPPSMIAAKGRIRPGKMFLVDTVAGRVMDDEEIKSDLAARRPYRAWVTDNKVSIEELPEPLALAQPGHATLREQQAVFGYTIEELQMVLTPMATKGEEPVGSMGNDTPLAVLSNEPQLLFSYFKQLFAQVTNPPIDSIREQLVMSLSVNIGPRVNILGERPTHARRIRVRGPVLTNAQLAKIRAMVDPHFKCRVLPIVFAASGGPRALHLAVESLCRRAAQAVREGCTILVLSDRGVTAEWAPIPSLLATAAVHHHLVREGLRTETGLIVETGEARDVTHFALLIGYGAGTVNPYLAFESLVDMVREKRFPESIDEVTAESKYITAVEKGLLKILSKMGISTIQSYCGAQVFEAIGLGPQLIERYFTGTASRIGGIEVLDVGEEALRRHAAAFAPTRPTDRLDVGGRLHYRSQGEHHNWNPRTIATLQHAVRSASAPKYEEFARAVDDEHERPTTLRGLMEFAEREPVSLEQVEPAAEIVRRFASGAMSFGSLSREAHETLALAMNTLGGRSNSGEGGEEPERHGTLKASAIKQVASGRFGVTTAYLMSAREIQIKMAQGAKPGEGGQLPGHKVDEVIARTRYATPGVSLISPPPHHDIYSIEDLAQLIFDLKNVNPAAAVSVKLVAELGVGTIASGVAKARADLILISGDSGGTGASPLSSIAHAGAPWELGLADTQQSLVYNDLRGRVRLQTDGQLKTGRDVVVAALLGAEEFGFSTAPLIATGCLMMRQCHLNTCPVGIATQDPALRARFAGLPEHVINYFFFVAEDVRQHMARLGFTRMDEMIGRSDLLRMRDMSHHWKARTLDLTALLHYPQVPTSVARRKVQAQVHPIDQVLDHELIEAVKPALQEGRRVHRWFPLRNGHRTVGAMLSGEIVKRHGAEGLAPGTIHFDFTGSAGQSFGAFCTRGVTLRLQGEANDFLGKGLSGGRLVVLPPHDAAWNRDTTIAVGNVALYGATSGEVFISGSAGERFAVRNSGAVAVVEGVGDHACEYMTGGVVVVLGTTGRNFAAGMSGGVAFVIGDDVAFDRRCNKGLVEVSAIEREDDIVLLHTLLKKHERMTGSSKAQHALTHWNDTLSRCLRVMPTEYRKVLESREARRQETHGRIEVSIERPAGSQAAASQRTGDGLARALPA